LATRGFQVLLIDLDHQGDATKVLRLDNQILPGTTNDVLLEERGSLDTLVPTLIDTLWLLPANEDLYGLDYKMQEERPNDFHLILRRITKQEAGGFDVIALDYPGNLQALSVMALAAADAYVIPMKPEFFFLDAAKQMLRKVFTLFL
jgi:chromosome partitioning protein